MPYLNFSFALSSCSFIVFTPSFVLTYFLHLRFISLLFVIDYLWLVVIITVVITDSLLCECLSRLPSQRPRYDSFASYQHLVLSVEYLAHTSILGKID